MTTKKSTKKPDARARVVLLINPLRSNGDQHQFSPNKILTKSRDKVMRVDKCSPKRKYLDLLSNSLNIFFKEIYRDRLGEFVCWCWGLKG